MELSVEELLNTGKATKIKNREYFSAEQYVSPFLERMSKFTNDFRVQVKLPDQMSLTRNNELNTEDTIFNRVWIQAILPEQFTIDNHSEVIGLVYGLDVRKPVAKIYRGALNMACLNLCVFNPDFLHLQEIEPETPIDYKCIQPLMEQTSTLKVCLDKMKDTEVPYDNTLINENLGMWVRKTISISYNQGFGKVKLSSSTAVDAYKLLYEKEDSPYYVKEGESTSMFNVYNAFTELISNVDTRDIMNKVEKTLLLRNILNV